VYQKNGDSFGGRTDCYTKKVKQVQAMTAITAAIEEGVI
tara:strand:+ start:423 stop:539 length:117 start_codon:yes stop_codon:yes gene_type:complete